jgi:WD40 repeat protein
MKKITLSILTILVFANVSSQTIKLQLGIRNDLFDGSIMAISADNKFGVTAFKKVFIIWDIETGKEINRINGHDGEISDIKFSLDSRYIISCDHSSSIKVWEISSGKLIEKLKVKNILVNTIACSPNGKDIVIGTGAGVGYLKQPAELYICNMFTGNIEKSFPIGEKDTYTAAFSKDGKRIYTLNYDEINVWDVASGSKILSQPTKGAIYGAFSNDDRYLIFFTGTSFALYDLENFVKLHELKTFSQPVEKGIVNFIPGQKYATVHDWVSGEDVLKIIDITSGTTVRMINNISTYTISPDGKKLMAQTGSTVSLFDVESGNLIRNFSGGSNEIKEVNYFAEEQFIVSKTTDTALIIWDINKCKKNPYTFTLNSKVLPDAKRVLIVDIEQTKYGPKKSNVLTLKNIYTGQTLKKFIGHKKEIDAFDISPDGKYSVSGTTYSREKGDGELILWDLNTGNEIKRMDIYYPKIKKHYTNRINKISFSPNGLFFATATGDNLTGGHVMFWDISTGKNFKTIDYSNRSYYNPPLIPLGFSQDGCYYFSQNIPARNFKNVDKKGEITVWDIVNNKIKGTAKLKNDITSFATSYDGKFLIFSEFLNSDIVLYDVSRSKELRRLDVHERWIIRRINALAFSHDNNKFLFGDEFGNISLMDIDGNILKKLEGHSDNITSLKFSSDDKTAISGSSDGTSRIWNISDGTWVSFLAGTGKAVNEWLVWTSDGFWDSSPNGGDLVAMVKGSECWNIDQFATKNNRPDIILNRLGSSNKELIEHYYAQYKKRLRKLRVSEESLTDNYYVPTSKIIDVKQNGNSVVLKALLEDQTYQLKQYNIFVNDVPLFGSYGKSIRGKSVEVSDSIILCSGNNKIEISCMNEKGVESFRALTFIENNTKINSDLYFLAFGVSKYNNSSYNLQYADKDAIDLNNAFKKLETKSFSHVYSKVLTNEEVTNETIKTAKEFVKDAKPDDYFVLYIAGHGVYEQGAEATFYFLTYNADLNNLSNTSVSFETIEDILQDIPPRNKLFLMDACESGEFDDEEQVSDACIPQDSGILSRGFIKTKSSSNQSSHGRTYLHQKDRYIYNDLARRSGAIVFSSSKGGELSYERSDIENGLFTEFIIKAITSTEADKDNSGTISMEELREYVSNKVAELSGERQHPTIDRDNIFQKLSFKIK